MDAHQQIALQTFSRERSCSTKHVRRIALCIQYDGKTFCGWQKQKKGNSVQGVLEEAISIIDPFRPINVIAAGRTDSGVHAAGQVVHFDSAGPIPPNRWASILNDRLPEVIRIRESVLMPSGWHACYSAIYRRYRYLIYNSSRPNLFLSSWSWHRYQFRLDEDLMKFALEGMIGSHDFCAFQRSGSTRLDSITTIQAVQLERHGDLIQIEIQASGFLYGMVRLLVGQLVALGEHRVSLETFEKRWKEKLRSEVKEAAPAKGLCFLRAGYAEKIFSYAAWYDSVPMYFLSTSETPKAPPAI